MTDGQGRTAAATSQSEKTTMRTMPSQNTGMLAPKSEATALVRSRSELGQRAESIPRVTPPIDERTSALPVRISVAW